MFATVTSCCWRRAAIASTSEFRAGVRLCATASPILCAEASSELDAARLPRLAFSSASSYSSIEVFSFRGRPRDFGATLGFGTS